MSAGRTDDPFFYTDAKLTIVPDAASIVTDEEWDAAVKEAGCPECGVLVLRGAHVCAAGVTTPPTYEVSFTMDFEIGR